MTPLTRYLFNFIIIIYLFASSAFGQKWVVPVYKKYSPATCIVIGYVNNQPYGFGTGFNVDEDGLIVTNYHVVKDAEIIIVQFMDGESFEVLGYTFFDKTKDICVMKISGSSLPIVKIGNSDDVEIGEEVIAIGNPEGAWHSVTKGIISQIVDLGTHKMFQTDVFIAPGSSGGPLFNQYGHVIGVTTGGLKEGMDINFAVPMNFVTRSNVLNIPITHNSSSTTSGKNVISKTKIRNVAPKKDIVTDQELMNKYIPKISRLDLMVDQPYELHLNALNDSWYEYETEYSGNVSSENISRNDRSVIQFQKHIYLRFSSSKDLLLRLNGILLPIQNSPYPGDVIYDSKRKLLTIRNYTPRKTVY
jgi:hypothetical protein